MAQLVFEVVEQILLCSDVEDLIRFKSVCKSWYSLIASPYFVSKHLKHVSDKNFNNHDLGRSRIVGEWENIQHLNEYHIVGSSNGLVCLSPRDIEFLLINPFTREGKKLPVRVPDIRLPSSEVLIRWLVVSGFGYDSLTDDYKLILGFEEIFRHETHFAWFSVKSNTYHNIGIVNYKFMDTNRTGILWDGSLHWFAKDQNKKKVILSFDLSSEKVGFKETALPDDPQFECHINRPRLGVIEEYLCIFNSRMPCSNKWVMKKHNVQRCWELLPYDYEMKYEVAYYVRSGSACYSLYLDGVSKSKTGEHIRAHLFVPTLVSPYRRKLSQRKNNKRRICSHNVISSSFAFSYILNTKRKINAKGLVSSKRNKNNDNKC